MLIFLFLLIAFINEFNCRYTSLSYCLSKSKEKLDPNLFDNCPTYHCSSRLQTDNPSTSCGDFIITLFLYLLTTEISETDGGDCGALSKMKITQTRVDYCRQFLVSLCDVCDPGCFDRWASWTGELDSNGEVAFKIAEESKLADAVLSLSIGGLSIREDLSTPPDSVVEANEEADMADALFDEIMQNELDEIEERFREFLIGELRYFLSLPREQRESVFSWKYYSSFLRNLGYRCWGHATIRAIATVVSVAYWLLLTPEIFEAFDDLYKEYLLILFAHRCRREELWIQQNFKDCPLPTTHFAAMLLRDIQKIERRSHRHFIMDGMKLDKYLDAGDVFQHLMQDRVEPHFRSFLRIPGRQPPIEWNFRDQFAHAVQPTRKCAKCQHQMYSGVMKEMPTALLTEEIGNGPCDVEQLLLNIGVFPEEIALTDKQEPCEKCGATGPFFTNGERIKGFSPPQFCVQLSKSTANGLTGGKHEKKAHYKIPLEISAGRTPYMSFVRDREKPRYVLKSIVAREPKNAHFITIQFWCDDKGIWQHCFQDDTIGPPLEKKLRHAKKSAAQPEKPMSVICEGTGAKSYGNQEPGYFKTPYIPRLMFYSKVVIREENFVFTVVEFCYYCIRKTQPKEGVEQRQDR